MPVLLLLFVGGALLLASVRGDPQQVGALVSRDFTGAKGFATFAAAFAVIGAIGFVPELKGVSRLFLVLMLVALIIGYQRSGGNLFKSLGEQWAAITATPPQTPVTASTGNTRK